MQVCVRGWFLVSRERFERLLVPGQMVSERSWASFTAHGNEASLASEPSSGTSNMLLTMYLFPGQST